MNSIQESILRAEIEEILREIEEPEIKDNILDLGLVQALEIDDDQVVIKLRRASCHCPSMAQIPIEIQQKVQPVIGGRKLEVIQTSELLSQEHSGDGDWLGWR